MYTISDILMDIDRGCLANNMIEDRFTYRIVYFVNDGNNGKKFYIDSSYRDLRKSLESIIRGNLTLTNNIVIAETTVLKRGKCTCLQSKAYSVWKNILSISMEIVAVTEIFIADMQK